MDPVQEMREARYWTAVGGGRLVCELCPHACRIADGKSGRCGVRIASGGRLMAAGYGLLSSAHLDPIEKKPLYHFHPGSGIFSIGGWGCNLSCSFCQNWSISQSAPRKDAPVAPDAVVSAARAQGAMGVAYTYNEPVINAEFVLDCARLARAAGLKNVLVTNGYVSRQAGAELLAAVDALNIDVKSMDDAFYREHCGAALAPVLNFCGQAADAGCHVEITNLLIPGLNDSEEAVRALAKWVAARLGRFVPLHLSAYRPEYKLRIPATPAETLERSGRICREELDFVYLGNISTRGGQDTLCPGCGRRWIARRGYSVSVEGLRACACAGCGRPSGIIPRSGGLADNCG